MLAFPHVYTYNGSVTINASSSAGDPPVGAKIVAEADTLAVYRDRD